MKNFKYLCIGVYVGFMLFAIIYWFMIVFLGTPAITQDQFMFMAGIPFTFAILHLIAILYEAIE